MGADTGMNNDNAMLTCPRCGSTDVIVEAVQAFFVNTNEHYCHATKTHDGYAKTRCLDCEWTGRRDALRAASGRAGGDAQQHTYKARRWCHGDGAWSEWQPCTAAQAASYAKDETFQVRATRGAE